MKVGDVLPTKKIRVALSEKEWAEFGAPKGKVFVLCLLGVEDIADDGVKLNPESVFEQLGWKKNA